VRALGSLIALLLISVPCLAQPPAAEQSGPAVLICSPKGVWQPHVDLDWLREMHGAGFEPDYLDHHSDFTWERIRRYNCLVIYGCPAA